MNGERQIKDVMDLPEAIKDWLASTRFTYISRDMNRQLGIREGRKIIIPKLIGELIMGEIDPRDFVAELSHRLNLSPSSAKIIAREIEEKMLHPIERDLKTELGIDVGLLHFSSEVGYQISEVRGLGSDGKGRGISEEGEKSLSLRVLPIPPFLKGVPEGRGISEEGEAPPTSNGPLIIHAEREEVKPPVVPPRPTFSIRIPLSQKKYTPPTPIKARIETGEQTTDDARPKMEGIALPPLGPLSSISGIKKSETPPIPPASPDPFVKKVVNYSEWRTPLD